MKNPADWLAALGPGPASRRGVAGAGGLFIAVILALAMYDIVRSYNDTVEATGRELESQSRVIAEQTARSIQAVDVVLKHLAEQLETGKLASANAEDLHLYLKEQAVGLVQTDGLAVYNADGTLRGVSIALPEGLPTQSVADEEPFSRLRNQRDAGLVIAGATRSAGTGRWVFPIGRRLKTRAGAFAGVVGAPGRIDYFQQFYGDAYPDSGTRVALLHQNTTLLARHPPAESALGRPFAIVDELLAARAKGITVTRNVSPLDGVDRFGAATPVPDYPLTVIVTRDAAVALAPWREQALGSALRTLALALLAGLLMAVVLRQLRRLDAARRSLETSRERYALAAAGSDDGIWDWDLRSGQAFESARARQLQGLPPGPETQPLAELQAALTTHPDDAARRASTMQAHLDGRTPAYEIEYRVRHADGQYRWIRVRALCIRDVRGQPQRIAGSVSDVDARKRAEIALRESEERFALAATGSDDGIWDLNYVTNLAFYSPRGRQIMGLADDEGLTVDVWVERITHSIHPDDLARRNAAIDDHLAGRTPAYESEYRMLRSDGQYRWVRVRGVSVRSAAGRLLRFAGSVTDIDARKQAEEALRLSEERYAVAMTGSHEGHWVWTMATHQIFVSATLAELFALPGGAQVIAAKDYFARIPLHPDDVARVTRNREDHLAGLTSRLDHEFRVVMPQTGEVRWFHTRAQCFRDADGRPQRLGGSTVDVTERRRAQEALRESEERFALAVAGSNDGVVDWDIVNDRLFISERAMQIIGIQSDTRVRKGMEWLARMPLHPDDRPQHDEDFRRHLKLEPGARSGDYRMRQPDGSFRWVRVRGMSVRDASGRAIRWAGSVTDIDAQKRIEEALRRSEERYQLAVEGSNEGLWDWDLATDLLFLSPRAQALTFVEVGEPLRPRDEWIALTAYHPDDLAPVRRAIVDHLHGLTPHYAVEYRVRHHSGQWHWYRQRGIAVRDADGRPTRMAGSMEDISARKAAEAERDRLELQLRQAQKLEAIGTLAGGIAHDFNNILSAILGYGELAQKDAAEGSRQRRHIDAAINAGQRAKSLVERILAFSRSGMGERVPVHVQSVVAEALDGVAATLPSRVELQRSLAAGDAGLLGDPTQIHQVVLNLCANAVQAMKGEGELTVRVDGITLDAPQPVTTSTLPAGRYVRLSVGDTGSGIAPHVLERIFDPFFTTKEIGVGTGLGLSLVHGIVTDLGGGIGIDSRPGEGATFTVYLPTHSYVAAPVAAPEAIDGGQGETVLLVDDEEALVRLGEEMLAELGYEPVGFSSSHAALAAFRADPDRFQAVLSDEAMPEMTGSELVAEIRRLRPAIPIVLMSGFVSPALLARARDAGVAEVLGKPLVQRDIARGLAHALRG